MSSLLSWSDFMGAGGVVGLGEEKRDMSEVLAEVLLVDQNLIGMIGTEVAKQIKHEHLEDELQGNVINGTWTYSSTTFAPAAALTQAQINKLFRSTASYGAMGAVLTSKSGEVVIRRTVDAPPPATTGDANWEVIGGWNHDVASISTADFGLGLPKPDEEDASPDTSQARTGRFSYLRVFERAVEESETRQHWDLYAISDEQAHQLRYRTVEIKNELNRAIINEWCKISGGAPDVSNLAGTRTMTGILQQLHDAPLDNAAGTLDANLNAALGTVGSATGDLTKSAINARVKALYEAGGLDAPGYKGAIVVHPTQAQFISAMDESYRRDTRESIKVGYYARTFVSDLGYEYPIVIDRAWPEAVVGILDLSRIKRTVLQGDDFHVAKMAKTGRTDKVQMSGQFGVAVKNVDKCHALIYNCSTS